MKPKYKKRIELERPKPVLHNNFRDVVLGRNRSENVDSTWPKLAFETLNSSSSSDSTTIHDDQHLEKSGLTGNSEVDNRNSRKSDNEGNVFLKAERDFFKENLVNDDEKPFSLLDFPSLANTSSKRKARLSQSPSTVSKIYSEKTSTGSDAGSSNTESKAIKDNSLKNEHDKKPISTQKELSALIPQGKSPKRKPRTKDKINIDVFEAIQLAAAFKLKFPKQGVAKSNPSHLSGNALDADRPLRRRGKVREAPKKKNLTKIKKAVVLSRLLRQGIRSKQLSEVKLFELGETLSALNLTSEIHRRFVIGQSNEEDKTTESSHQSCDIKLPAHSKKFRSYCSNLPNPDLREKAQCLITTLRSFQDRLYHRDPEKAKRKRRYVCGFKETIKYLHSQELKLIIIATNLEASVGDPVEKMIKDLKELSERKGVPLAFTGTAYDLGYWTLKKSRISIIGVLNYSGCEGVYQDFLECLKKAQFEYKEKLEELRRSVNHQSEDTVKIEDVIKETIIKKLTVAKKECDAEDLKPDKKLESSIL